MKFNLQLNIMVAVILGVLAGFFATDYLDVYTFLGKTFINLLKYIVVPLVIASLITGIISLGSLDSLRQMGFKTLIYFIGTTVISSTIGLTLAVFPEAWIQFFTDDIKAFEVTKKYIQIVGPFYIFQGIGLSLYFASQGANAMKWPTIATIARFIIACAGGGISVYWLDLGIESIFISSSAAMAIFGLMIFISIKKGAWRKNF